MEQPSRKLSPAVWGGLLLVAAILLLAFVASRHQAGRVGGPLPVFSQVGAFTLTNQLARARTLADLRGQVWVADIIFTRCPGPCAKMTRQMADLQAHLPAGQPVKLVSLTTDPDFDQPDVLKRYAEKFGARDDAWWFLTGTEAEIKRLATDGLKLTAEDKKPEERTADTDLFIHSTIFVVVDKRGRLRAVFQTQSPDSDDTVAAADLDPAKFWEESRSRILSVVQQLLAEN